MRGAHHIIIQNRYLKYEFDIKRNLTIIEGDSATGKTTLVEMIREYNQGGSSSGIQLSCDTACRVLEGDLWRELIGLVHNTIFFIDEGNAFVDTEEFAKAVKESDHYYVIVTRESLEMLPISVTEVYGIRSSGKYGRLEPVYHEMYRIYETVGKEKSFAAPDLLITEDSNAGYEFFEDVASRYHRKCMSADGKSNIYGLISAMQYEGTVLVIADGAAFASQMKRVTQVLRRKHNVFLFLPESFEWLILKSGLIDGKQVAEMLEHPEDFIESRDYFSWERFFARFLAEMTRGSWQHYRKDRLNDYYRQEKVENAILAQIEGIELC